jgi:hypothetical protein
VLHVVPRILRNTPHLRRGALLIGAIAPQERYAASGTQARPGMTEEADVSPLSLRAGSTHPSASYSFGDKDVDGRDEAPAMTNPTSYYKQARHGSQSEQRRIVAYSRVALIPVKYRIASRGFLAGAL